MVSGMTKCYNCQYRLRNLCLHEKTYYTVILIRMGDTSPKWCPLKKEE